MIGLSTQGIAIAARTGRRTHHPGRAAGCWPALALVGWLTACAVPDEQSYQRPELPEKDDWTLTTDEPLSPAATIRPDWWAAFGDPRLDDLIRKAIAGSPDIAILAARIDAAGIGLASEEISNLPTLGLGTGTDLALTPDGTTRSYSANLTGLNWEIDLWGRTRRSVQAQQAEFRATEADFRAGYLSLVAEVATNYFQLRQLDEQIETQQAGLTQNQRIFDILQRQQREGLVPATRVIQQRAELRNLEKELLDLRRQRTITENRLATLLGVPAGNLHISPAPLSRSVHQVTVPAGLPADLLSRRPDILAAEYRVLRAYELVGKARLAKLPTISLTGSGGLASAALSALLSNWTLGLGLAVNMPIFDPNLDLEIERTEVEQQIAEQDYRRVVIQAFEEVENALVNLASRREQVEALERQIADLRSVNATVYARLRAGLVSQLEVFESERSLLSTEQTLLALQHQMLQDTVTLYKALGGGWPAERVTLAER